MAKRKLKQSKAAKAARRRYRANKNKKSRKYAKKKAGHVKHGCGKGGWKSGTRVYWKCKKGAKKHAYKR